MKVKISNYIAQKLKEEGISHVFSVTGGGAMHLNDALGHEPGLTCIYNHHEQACAMAAESYARFEGTIACVCVTTGPGGTNAITGVAGGWLDSIPMLVLSGQVRYDTTARWSGVGIRAMGDQEFDICRSVECMTKYCEMVIDPLRIRFCLEKALYLAYSGRPGPCWLDVPLNVQGAYVDTDELIGFDPKDYEAGGDGWAAPSQSKIAGDQSGAGEKRQVLPPACADSVLEQVLERIAASSRPVFYAGNGIRIAGAHEVFQRVADKLGIPVVTGWNSQDALWHGHRLHVGQGGIMGDRAGNFAVQNSDLVIAVGSRLSIRQVGYNYETWAREAYVIVCDADPEELKKPSVHSDMRIHADARDFLEGMERILDQKHKPFFGKGNGLDGRSWVETCQMWKKRYPLVQPKHMEANAEKKANVYAMVRELDSRVPENANIVVGNGSACVVGGHAWFIKKGQRFITQSAIASMGYDLPAAIGAAVARPGEDIILLTGDGSIQMNLQELQTILHHHFPVKIFLINNQGYHSIRQTQKKFFGEPLVGVGTDSRDLSFPDMKKLSAAYGYPFFRAEHNEELGAVVGAALAQPGPVICEVMVDEEQVFEPRSSAKTLPDGTIVSPPLEDLSPFLPEDEMDAMMIIPRIK